MKKDKPIWMCTWRNRVGTIGQVQNTIESVIKEAQQNGAVAIVLLYDTTAGGLEMNELIKGEIIGGVIALVAWSLGYVMCYLQMRGIQKEFERRRKNHEAYH